MGPVTYQYWANDISVQDTGTGYWHGPESFELTYEHGHLFLRPATIVDENSKLQPLEYVWEYLK